MSISAEHQPQRVYLTVDTDDLQETQQQLSRAAGVTAEEFSRLCQEIEMLKLPERIDIPELKIYSNPLNVRPSKRSRRAKRGHNRALDRIIT